MPRADRPPVEAAKVEGGIGVRHLVDDPVGRLVERGAVASPRAGPPRAAGGAPEVQRLEQALRRSRARETTTSLAGSHDGHRRPLVLRIEHEQPARARRRDRRSRRRPARRARPRSPRARARAAPAGRRASDPATAARSSRAARPRTEAPASADYRSLAEAPRARAASRTQRRWNAASFGGLRLTGCGHVHRCLSPSHRSPPPLRPCRAAGPLRALRPVRARPRLRRRELGGGARTHRRHRGARAAPQRLRRARRPVGRLRGRRRARPARVPLRRAPLRRHRSRRDLDPPPPPRRFRAPADDPHRRNGARARRLRLLPGRAAPPGRPRLRRHGHDAHRAEPELRLPRQPLQPDRSRAEPALRLRARRRRRAVPRLDAPQPADRVRALSRADAARDRRDRQPLLLRRSSRRPRGRGRLVGRLAPRSLPARRWWGCPHPQTPGLRIHPARSPEQPRTRSTHPRERKQCHP